MVSHDNILTNVVIPGCDALAGIYMVIYELGFKSVLYRGGFDTHFKFIVWLCWKRKYCLNVTLRHKL